GASPAVTRACGTAFIFRISLPGAFLTSNSAVTRLLTPRPGRPASGESTETRGYCGAVSRIFAWICGLLLTLAGHAGYHRSAGPGVLYSQPGPEPVLRGP